MNVTALYEALVEADSLDSVEAALHDFEQANSDSRRWLPVGGRENNRGTIDSAADPGRSLVERLTNGIDAVLEYQHDAHSGMPDCRTPKEAAACWLNVAANGLSDMTPRQRRALAQDVSIKVLAGESRASRIVEIRDGGIGLTPDDMPRTILSLNESNKMQKHYLAGAYGQGGSSTFASSRYTFIASRAANNERVGFTVVKFEDLPPEEYKIGRYVYLVGENVVLSAELPADAFRRGTLIRHFGYDLTNYSASIGPSSLYGLLNETLFDPVLPVWLDDHAVHGYRRVIKGARNALNGATDEGDVTSEGPTLPHSVRLFYSTIGDFGRIGIEYWVLERPTATNKRPSAVFVNPNKPIILTLNGQNQAELSHLLIKKNAELPYLAPRLICHIDCNNLTATAKRALFVSNRENARHGAVQELIQQEIVAVLRSDDELMRLNTQAREQGMQDRDATAEQEMRREVARLLHLQGVPVDIGTAQARSSAGMEGGIPRPRPPRPRPPAQPIQLREPPTFIRFVADPDEEITFHPEQRRYVRVETDANSTYHHPTDPALSRINIISTTNGVTVRGSTSLEGGRLRAIFEASAAATVGATGSVRVELSRPGLPMLSDSRTSRIVPPPPTRQESQQLTLPQFLTIPVSPGDDRWAALTWSDDISSVASEAQMEGGTLNIYYSTAFPKYAEQRSLFERRNLSLAESFTKRYEIWIAVHSLLVLREEQTSSTTDQPIEDEQERLMQGLDRKERCRTATLAAMFAARESQLAVNAAADTD